MRGSRKTNADAADQNDGLELVRHRLMHYRTVSVPLDAHGQSLQLRAAPLNGAWCFSDVAPPVETLQARHGAHGVIVVDEINERVSQACTGLYFPW